MTRPVTARFAIAGFSVGGLATAISAATLMLSGVAAARADTTLPASATTVRNAIIAMSLADAAMPAAVAVSGGVDQLALVPASAAAMKPESSAAMAAMRPTSGRNANGGYVRVVSSDRRVRTYAYPFPLILGIAY